MKNFLFLIIGATVLSCHQSNGPTTKEPVADFVITKDQKHSKFSKRIPPVLSVPTGSIIEFHTEEATDGQLQLESDTSDLMSLSFDPIHPLTGPVFVEGAKPGDVLKIKIHKIEIGDWGWSAILPGFGFLADEFETPFLKTFDFSENKNVIEFTDKIKVPLKPFAGVIGVAPDTDSLLSTIPPRANGGNMDDPNITEGSIVYLPVFVEGALFSIGDAHAAQGLGEVCGTAVEAPMRFIVEVDIIKNNPIIKEPQYETEDYYAVTAYGQTIDEAAKKATRYMIEYLVENHGLTRNEAYVLCSISADLKIAEVVDVPNMLVTMHMSKKVLGI